MKAFIKTTLKLRPPQHLDTILLSIPDLRYIHALNKDNHTLMSIFCPKYGLNSRVSLNCIFLDISALMLYWITLVQRVMISFMGTIDFQLTTSIQMCKIVMNTTAI